MGIHGGAIETSIMLHVAPDQVRRPKPRRSRRVGEMARDFRTCRDSLHRPGAVRLQPRT